LAAYLRWSHEAPRKLVGDFAFAIWDDRRRMLYAARDHLGIRPLYYTLIGDQIVVGSDVRQLFPTIYNLRARLNRERILDRLTRRYRRHGQTYFTDIAMLRPGHTMTAVTAASVREDRYWFPPPLLSATTSYEENCEQIQAIFLQAVRDRLDSNRPIVAHSSGGFDSTTIVMAADKIYRDEPDRPSLITASALTPGTECDDGAYIQAVARHVSFETYQWSALSADSTDLTGPSLAAPGLRRGIGGGPRNDMRLAHERNARILLSGFGGDEVKFAGGGFRDLVRNRRWSDLVQDRAFRKSARRSWREIPRLGLGFLSPQSAVKFLVWRRTRAPSPPPWLGKQLRSIWPPPSEALELVDFPWSSHLVCDLWSRATRPHVSCNIDYAVLQAADQGIELRLPYLDVRLVEFILAMPWAQRIPQGDLRRLAHDALGRFTPPELADRVGQGSWMGVWAHNCRTMSLAETIESGEWHSGDYVERPGVQALLRRVTTSSHSDPLDAVDLANLAALEAWLREINGYTRHREVSDARQA
jgi:asparagine synthase (glutamine-hydrolysing)